MTLTKNPKVVDLFSDTIIAGAAIEAHRFVGFNNQHCGAGALPKGISKAAIASGAAGAIGECGKYLVLVGAGGVTAGARVKSDANGKAVLATAAAVAIVNTNGVTVSIENTNGITVAAPTIPAGATPVTSDNANPTLTQGAVGGNITSAATVGGNVTSAATPSGGYLPEAIGGIAELTAAEGEYTVVRYGM
jgi:hypothetical protein